MHQMLSHLGNPQNRFTSIHIAGTNGKGSVAFTCASAWTHGGYQVGLFSSPHISSFRERILVDGSPIPEADLITFLEKIFSLSEKLKLALTFFEVTTLVAFLYFSSKQVDVALIETGLGGRWDATNVLSPLLSVITSIGLDHTELLGESIESIAREKAGIIKPFTPLIIGPKVPYDPIFCIAEKKHASIHQVPFKASVDETNKLISKTVIDQTKDRLPVASSSIQYAFTCNPPCRFETIEVDSVPIILDIAHNSDALHNLLSKIPSKSQVILGLSKEKNALSLIKIIFQKGCVLHLIETTHPRLHRVETLLKACHSLQINPANLHSYPSINQCIRSSIALAKKQSESLLICGSFYFMHECRVALEIPPPFLIADSSY